MSPQWNTTERGKNREDEDSERSTDYDAYSCMDLMGLPGSDTGIRDVEDPEIPAKLGSDSDHKD